MARDTHQIRKKRLTGWLMQVRRSIQQLITTHSAPGTPRPGAAGRNRPALRETLMMVNIQGGAHNHLAEALSAEGYDVCTVQQASETTEKLRQEHPSLIIVCGAAASEACSALRRVTSVPILALLPQPTDLDVLNALEAGADDCQDASIGTSETILRARALLRRGSPVALPSK